MERYNVASSWLFLEKKNYAYITSVGQRRFKQRLRLCFLILVDFVRKRPFKGGYSDSSHLTELEKNIYHWNLYEKTIQIINN